MFPSQRIGKCQRLVQLLGAHQESSAIGFPFHKYFFHVVSTLWGREGCILKRQIFQSRILPENQISLLAGIRCEGEDESTRPVSCGQFHKNGAVGKFLAEDLSKREQVKQYIKRA